MRSPTGWICAAVLCACLLACGREDDPVRAERRAEYTCLDSLRVYLQALRTMDHQIGQIVLADTVSSEDIVPQIAERFHPTIVQLQERVDDLAAPPRLMPVKETLTRYLGLRREAYDAAISGMEQGRSELFDTFSRKQIEADGIGRLLETQVREAKEQTPGYR